MSAALSVNVRVRSGGFSRAPAGSSVHLPTNVPGSTLSEVRDLLVSRRAAHRREVIAGAEIRAAMYAARPVDLDVIGAGMTTCGALCLNAGGIGCLIHEALPHSPMSGDDCPRLAPAVIPPVWTLLCPDAWHGLRGCTAFQVGAHGLRFRRSYPREELLRISGTLVICLCWRGSWPTTLNTKGRTVRNARFEFIPRDRAVRLSRDSARGSVECTFLIDVRLI